MLFVKFNGTVQTPNVVAEFEEEVIAGDIITFEYNYFEIINGVTPSLSGLIIGVSEPSTE